MSQSSSLELRPRGGASPTPTERATAVRPARPPYIPAPPSDRKRFAAVRWRVIGAILRADLDCSARVVGCLIVDRIGHRSGYIWARADTLATAARISESTLHRATRALVAGGYIERRAGRGYGQASEYWIDWQRWAPQPDRADIDDVPF